MKIAHRIISVVYELSFLLVFALAVIAPIHNMFTEHVPVVQSIDESRAIIRGDLTNVSVGDEFPLYRFNGNWKVPIGDARITRINDTGAEIVVNPNRMNWPLGRHGTITLDETSQPFIALGSEQGFMEGDSLSLFRNREPVGQALVTETESNRSYLQVAADLGDPTELVASEFTIPTQVAIFNSRIVSALEICFVISLLLLYTALYIYKQRSPFIIAGERIRRFHAPRRALFWIAHLLLGTPFTWFMSKMPLYVLAYIGSALWQQFTGDIVYWRPTVDAIVPYVAAIIAVSYYGYLAWKRASPILAFWHLISYKGTGVVKTVSWKRGLLNWALHLIVVYVFALILFGFLQGNIQAARDIGWPAPSPEAAFEFWKYVIWTLTVIGCLIGYGYSVLSILWGKFIRSVDFTITGWLTNGFCYPLFGVVIWQMIPEFTGSDPIITAGPALWLMLGLGFLLNFLYMLSIWNLGTMFDLMVDKGVRTTFFYNTVRHPNYALESAMFFVTELVGLTLGIHWLAISMYFFIYWIRSEREDNFMQYSNPAYEPYQRQTPYKFIPGIY